MTNLNADHDEHLAWLEIQRLMAERDALRTALRACLDADIAVYPYYDGLSYGEEWYASRKQARAALGEEAGR